VGDGRVTFSSPGPGGAGGSASFNLIRADARSMGNISITSRYVFATAGPAQTPAKARRHDEHSRRDGRICERDQWIDFALIARTSVR
jgi:hypothetical protein